MTNVRERAGDWLIIVGAVLLVVLFVIGVVSAVLGLRLQRDNHALLQQTKVLAAKADRNHADNLVIEQDIRAFCQTFHVHCALVTK